MNNIGNTLRELNQLDEAYKIQKETLNLCKRVLGQKHPDRLKAMNNIGNTLWALNKLDEAYRMIKETIALSIKINGTNHPHTFLLKMNESKIKKLLNE